MFRKKKEVVKEVVEDQRNPWLDIEHECDWLPANEGKELVCGLCGDRKPA